MVRQRGLRLRLTMPWLLGIKILLHVIDMDEISDKPIRIDPNGFVDIPLAGRFHASGLTLEQFKAELATRLSKYITNPHISVNLAEDDSRPVSIIGSVNAPGVHQISGDKRLIEVLSLAGGVKDDAGSQVIVTREQAWGKLNSSRRHSGSGYRQQHCLGATRRLARVKTSIG